MFRAEEKGQMSTHLLVVGSNRYGQVVMQVILPSYMCPIGQEDWQTALEEEVP